MVVDPFAGSCNTLYWLTRRLPGSRAVGCELDDQVFRHTRQNLANLGLPIGLLHAEYTTAVGELIISASELVVAFLAPPWGAALDATNGLDLGRTAPPVAVILDFMFDRLPNPMLCAVQIFERTDAASLKALEAMFEWSTAHVYDLNAPGQNHGCSSVAGAGCLTQNSPWKLGRCGAPMLARTSARRD